MNYSAGFTTVDLNPKSTSNAYQPFVGHQKQQKQQEVASKSVNLETKGYFMLIFFTAALTLNSITFQIDNQKHTADYLYYISMIAYLILATRSLQFIEYWGLKATIIAALILQSAALLLGRTLNDKVFGTSLVGPTVSQIISSIAQVLLMNSVTRFSSLWFGEKGRILATGIMLGGFHIGQYIIFWFLKMFPEDDYASAANGFHIAITAINTGLLLIVIAFYVGEPEDNSSESQVVYKGKAFRFNAQFEAMAQDENGRRYMRIFAFLLVYCFCSPYNFYWYLFFQQKFELDHYQMVSQILQPITQLAGILSTAFVLYTVMNYKMTLVVLILMNLIATLLTELSYVLGVVQMFEICYFIQGFCIGGLRMAIYEIITEVMYPVLPSMTLGVLHACSNTVILAATVVSDEIDKNNKEHNFKENIFNDLIQLTFLIGLTVCGQKIIKYGINAKRTQIDLKNKTENNNHIHGY